MGYEPSLALPNLLAIQKGTVGAAQTTIVKSETQENRRQKVHTSDLP